MKRTSKWIALCLALLMMAVVFASCEAPAPVETPASEAPAQTDAAAVVDEESVEPAEQAAGENPLIGFSLFDNSIPWAISFTNSVFEEAEARGYEYIYADAQNDTAKQLADVEDLIAQGIDILCLTPIEFEAAAPCLEAAKEADIPVFLLGRSAKGEAGVDYVTEISSDFVWEGEEAGKWLAQKTGGKARIVEITGTVGATSATGRADGFHKAIEEYPEMEIVVSQTADFVRSTGQKVMENIIQSLGKDGFDAVYTHADEMTIGAVLAMKAAGLKPGEDIMVVSVDGSKEAVQMVKDGDVNCVVTCTPIFGEVTFDTIEKYLAGEKIEVKTTNPDRVVDVDNVDEELILAY